MNLVSTLIIRTNGLVTPLFWRIWVQNKEKSANAKATKCKRNTALYQLSGSDWKGNPRFSPVKPGQLLTLNYAQLLKMVIQANALH